jgi:hypothetical protein
MDRMGRIRDFRFPIFDLRFEAHGSAVNRKSKIANQKSYASSPSMLNFSG